MKKKYSTYMLFVCLSAFTACENLYEGDEPEIEDKEINVTFASTVLNYKNGESVESFFGEGTAVGVFMNTNGESLTPENVLGAYANRRFIAGDGGKLVPGEASENMVFMPGAAKVDFLAYAPYKDNLRDDYIFHLDISDQTDESAYGLLVSNNAKGKYKTTSAVKLKFIPAVAAIYIDIEYTEGISEDDMEGAEMKLHNVNLESDFSLSQGVVEISSLGNIDISRDGNKAMAVVIPTAGDNNGRKITVKGRDIDYTYEIPADVRFDSGKIYLYKLKVSPKGIEIVSGGIEDWVVDEENGTIN